MDAHLIRGTEPVYLDGLTPEVIEGLLREAEAHWTSAARPTAAFLDGTADLRRERRNMRRAVGAVVRSLPARPARDFLASDGEVA